MRKLIQHYTKTLLITLCCFSVCHLGAQHMDHSKMDHSKMDHSKMDLSMGGESAGVSTLGEMVIPNAQLQNQNGESVNFQELVKDKAVALNFIFTTCTTICPPMGANFVKLKKMHQEHVGKDLVMISVSIDPVTDNPARLKAWSDKFDPGEGWTLLTGDKHVVDKLLKDLNVFTPLIEDHAPIILMGKEGAGDWVRANGLASPEKLSATLQQFLETDVDAASDPDRAYFTDAVLVNQYGEKMRLWSDLLQDKIVVINPFFAECTGACPVMHSNLQQVQAHFADRIGKDIYLISITVDPENDTPEKLAMYAKGYGAKKGWFFLTGDEENLNTALYKLGNQVPNREAHKNIILVGNTPTRLWKKVNGLGNPADLIKVVESVVLDQE